MICIKIGMQKLICLFPSLIFVHSNTFQNHFDLFNFLLLHQQGLQTTFRGLKCDQSSSFWLPFTFFFFLVFHCNAVIFTSILKIEETPTVCPTKNAHLYYWTIGQHDKHDETILHLWVMDCTSVGSCLCTILLNDMVRHFFYEAIV